MLCPLGRERWARAGAAVAGPAGFESRWRHSKRTARISPREADGRLGWDHGVPPRGGFEFGEGPSQRAKILPKK
jgi:hypothetical protein